MNIQRKIARIKPETIILLSPDRPQIILDYEKTSSLEIMKIIRTTPWTEIEGYCGETMVMRNERSEFSDLDEDDEEDRPEVFSALPALPALPTVDTRTEPFVAPERWLSLMIHAQQSASAGARETIALLLETMQNNNDRSQDLLTQAHNMIVSQQEQIETLVERLHADPPEKEDTDWEGRIERIVEGLAPIVAPLLMRATQGPAPQAPQALPAAPQAPSLPPGKSGKKAR